jgi:GntR family transcriptional repressor for pyruvate dehydrogenase complex
MAATFERIKVPKSYDVLAEHLREKILSGDVAAGSHLPSERALVDQTGLSRGSIREALRKLEVEGLVRTQPGRQGGNIATLPGQEAVSHLLGLFIRGRRVQFRSLLETQFAIEPTLARLAALNRTDAELKVLEASTADAATAIIERPRFLAENVRWHNAIAIASHNELLAAFMLSISKAMHDATAVEDFATLEIRRQSLADHRKILAAVKAGDGDAAFRRMERHIKGYTAQVLARAPAEIAL